MTEMSGCGWCSMRVGLQVHVAECKMKEAGYGG